MRIQSALALPLFSVAHALAQQRPVTANDYARAERFMAYNVSNLVFNTGVRPTWLPDERFWHRVPTQTGSELFLVDPARGVKTKAFQDARLVGAIRSALGAAADCVLRARRPAFARRSEQGFRFAHAAEPAARLRYHVALDDAPALGLLREEPLGVEPPKEYELGAKPAGRVTP